MKHLFILLSFLFCANIWAQKDLDQLLKKYNDQINLIYVSNVKYEKYVSKRK